MSQPSRWGPPTRGAVDLRSPRREFRASKGFAELGGQFWRGRTNNRLDGDRRCATQREQEAETNSDHSIHERRRVVVACFRESNSFPRQSGSEVESSANSALEKPWDLPEIAQCVAADVGAPRGFRCAPGDMSWSRWHRRVADTCHRENTGDSTRCVSSP